MFYIDLWTNGNTTSRALPVVTMFETGSMKIDKYHEKTEDKAFVNGHYYTDKAPLPTYIIMPFFWIAKSTGIIKPDENESYFGKPVYAIGDVIVGVIPFVLILLIVYKEVADKSINISPALLTMLPFYGSFLYVFSGTYFAHLLSGLLLLLSYIQLKKQKYFFSGIYGGLSFLCEYNHALILFLWGFLIIINMRSVKSFFYYSFGILPSIIFIMIYNYIFTGSPLDMLYKFHTYSELHSNYGFSHPTLASIWGLTFSNYRGLIFYIPFLFLGIVYLVKYYKQINLKALIKSYLFFPFIIYFLMISSYFGWWGGWTYGPRLLTGIGIILLYECIIMISKKKVSRFLFYLFSGFGLICAFMAKATVVYSVPTDVKNPFIDLIIPNLIKGKYNENNLLTIIFDLSPKISFYLYIVIFTLLMTLLYLIYISKKSKITKANL
ncbi:MAG: hypothetical protein Kow0068_14560 [Marinilabiliales bacterium]